MLRTTVAAFAAGVGGADPSRCCRSTPLSVSPTCSAGGSRGTPPRLLISESHVARVADPAGGSYAVEKLTDDLAAAGWAELGRIEESGGVAAALGDGSLRGRIDEVAADVMRRVARRRRPLTGVSEFPHLGEALPERPPHPHDGVRRYAAPFEALRDEPAAVPVFLATMGTVAAHTARASFATNLFAAAESPSTSPGPPMASSRCSRRTTARRSPCLAGADPTYAEWGADLVAALRDAGASWVIVAGKPGDLGVDDACAMGVDALDFLTRTREKLS